MIACGATDRHCGGGVSRQSFFREGVLWGEGSRWGLAMEEGLPPASDRRRKVDQGPHMAKGMVPMIKKKEPQARIDLFFMFKLVVDRRGGFRLEACGAPHVRRW
jgi:hypothetical protein